MGELHFVGLAVFVWCLVVALIASAIACVLVIIHIINVEVRHFRRERRAKVARLEMLKRAAKLRRYKEQQAKKLQFFAILEEIDHES